MIIYTGIRNSMNKTILRREYVTMNINQYNTSIMKTCNT